MRAARGEPVAPVLAAGQRERREPHADALDRRAVHAAAVLRKLREQGYEVNGKRVSRLMEVMGIAAVYPKPKLSQPGEGHKIYPYLLEGVGVTRANQVWSTDITYIRMAAGSVYLVAVMDWFSRFVLSWALSVTMELSFCMEALQRALRRRRPEIFNSDQGSQFTSEKFTGELESRGIAVSMDGRRRCLDSNFIERLWRSLKYEEVYLRDYARVPEAQPGSAPGSSSTTTSGHTKVWSTGRRRDCTWHDEWSNNEEGGIAELGGSAPKPPRFNALGPEWMDYNKGT